MRDTFQRSCEHWSEARRREMEDFYTLASVDYRHLAQAFDWKAWLEARQVLAGDRPLRLLDVACGSGKFPSALVKYGQAASASIRPVDYNLLDPSAFSIGEARQALNEPFVAGQEYEITLQTLECPQGAFDIVWAIHALYAVPETELEAGITRFLHAVGGVGVIAQACEDSHYVSFYRRYLEAFRGNSGIPYTSAEQIVSTLQRMGVGHEIQEIAYENEAPKIHRDRVQGFLQRCVFDHTLSLDEMLAHPVTGTYLARCVRNGAWHFKQRVMLLFIQP